ncbi:MAG: DHA2 family efflux MFS transporter permease subunit [Proteobacteria bacterium]|nr:DHA2 family efflux MFS transporter permease subunit [Pseudomonadota bacterium]
MCAGMFMAVLDIQIVASSLPDIERGLDIPTNLLSWVQTAYLIAEVIAIPLTGWLTRLLSLRGLFVVAVLGFTAASLGCALVHGFGPFIALRAVQGFCGGSMIPTVFTSVFLMFPRRSQAKATAIGGVVAMLAPTLGPTLGGYITETYSWHWLFLINVGPGLIVAVLAFRLLKHERPAWDLLARLDYRSLFLLAVFLGSLELVLKEGPKRNWSDGVVLALIAICLATGMSFIRRSLRQPDPLVDLRLLQELRFAAGCLFSFILGMGLYGSVYLLPLFLSFVRQHTALEIGRIMLVTGAAQLLAAPFAAWLERRSDCRLLTGVGYAMFALGMIVNGFATYETDFDGLFWPQVLRGVAMMLCILPTTTLALAAQLASHMAEASGLFNLMRNLGGAIGIALIDTVLELRPSVHVATFVERLQAGDPRAALAVGLPTDRFHNVPLGPVDEATKAVVAPLVERAAAVASFNEAWLLVGILFAASLLLLFLLGPAVAAERSPTGPEPDASLPR